MSTAFTGASPPVHDVKESPAIEDIHSRLKICLPTLDPELVVGGFFAKCQGLPEKPVGDLLKRSLLSRSLLLHPSKEIVIDTDRRPAHTSKCIPETF